MPKILIRLVLPGCVIALLFGCGGNAERKTGAVTGSIELDGNPLTEVQVMFEDAEHGLRASAAVEDGTYQFDLPLIVGTYQVALQPPPAPPPGAGSPPKPTDRLPIPKKYLTTAQSGLTADVKEGENTFDFRLDP